MHEFEIQTEMGCQPDAGAGSGGDERAVAECAINQGVDAPARIRNLLLCGRRRYRQDGYAEGGRAASVASDASSLSCGATLPAAGADETRDNYS